MMRSIEFEVIATVDTVHKLLLIVPIVLYTFGLNFRVANVSDVAQMIRVALS